eukprot:16310776-Heterocapsa_arctica.AAC.1
MVEIMANEGGKFLLRALVQKPTTRPSSASTMRHAVSDGQLKFILMDVMISTLKILKKPHFDITEPLKMHGDCGDEAVGN